MEADRGSRPSWLEWFPVKERVINGFDCTISDTLLLDAAGGRGHDIQAFLKKFPEAPGRLIVEEQPHVIEDIRDLDQSIERIGFDLFDKQPIKGPSHYIASLYLRSPLFVISPDNVHCRRAHLLSQIHPPRLERRRLPQNPPQHRFRYKKGPLEIDHRKIHPCRHWVRNVTGYARLGDDGLLQQHGAYTRSMAASAGISCVRHDSVLEPTW